MGDSTPNRGFGGGHHRGKLSPVWYTVTIPYGGLKLKCCGPREMLEALWTEVLSHLGGGTAWRDQNTSTLEETYL